MAADYKLSFALQAGYEGSYTLIKIVTAIHICFSWKKLGLFLVKDKSKDLSISKAQLSLFFSVEEAFASMHMAQNTGQTS